MSSAFTRRGITVPAMFLGCVASWITLPVWLPILLVTDVVRGVRFAGTRLAAMLTWMFTCEVLGLVSAAGIGILRALGVDSEARFRERNYQLQNFWAGAIFRGVERIFGLRVQIEPGGEPPPDGPILLLLRHASMGDTLLPSVLFAIPYGYQLRYVLKKELLWDPCLDIVGQRLPNVFVDRSAPNGKTEIGAVAALARNLEPHEGVLIYPEGTRFSAEKRARAVERLQDTGDPAFAARAARLRNVLPPRLGGVSALLDRFASEGNGHVVVCGHVGFEGAAGWSDLWSGRVIDREIRVRCWTTPASQLPAERGEWLLDAWTELDAWIGEALRGQDSSRNVN
ncbi:MAG: 1-acyl-sn-glycerol-3-phosphate acyltransferase [Myxococcota bacterium]